MGRPRRSKRFVADSPRLITGDEENIHIKLRFSCSHSFQVLFSFDKAEECSHGAGWRTGQLRAAAAAAARLKPNTGALDSIFTAELRERGKSSIVVGQYPHCKGHLLIYIGGGGGWAQQFYLPDPPIPQALLCC